MLCKSTVSDFDNFVARKNSGEAGIHGKRCTAFCRQSDITFSIVSYDKRQGRSVFCKV